MVRLEERLRLIVVTPGRGEPRELERLCAACIEAGASALWIRERSLEPAVLQELLGALRERAAARGTLLILAGHLELPAAARPGGFHLGWLDAAPSDVRARVGPDCLLGYSAHDPLEPDRFAACDYVTLSPIFETSSKPVERPPLGLERFGRLAEGLDLPVVGLGGIDRHNAGRVIRAGAAGVAVMRAVTGARHPGRAVAELRRIVDEALV